MDDELKEFLDLFFEEAFENLGTLETGLLRLETAGNDAELLNSVFRAAHSIKGGASSFGLTDVSHFAHIMEGLLDQVRRGERTVTSDLASLLLRATDSLKELLGAARANEPASDEPAHVLEELERAKADTGTTPAAAPAPGPLAATATAPLPEAGFAEIWSEDGPDVVITASKPAAAPSAPAAGAIRRRATDADVATSIRVSTGKVDQLVNLVGELVIAQSIVTQIAQDLRPESLVRLGEALADVERNTRELQERVMSIRMVPISSVFHRFTRVVRDLAAQIGKRVHLEMEGEDTEIDKGVIELLGDPLTHLVRNAVDHGIETPEERSAAGKFPEGTLKLVARTEGGTVHIEVVDDGKGLDRERIRRKAVERGLLRPDETPTDEQIFSLIFQAGFSTAATVTDVSGRGVGMDVVKRNVERLNGGLQVDSRPNRGTRIRIRLPLTLAILDGLTLAVGGHVFVLPLSAIVESLRPTTDDVRRVLGKGDVILLRGETLPLLRTHALLGLRSAVTDPTQGLVVIVSHEGRRMAVFVDEVLGQQQVVIKNLDLNYRRVEGTMGATIMGDGRVALILDVAGLARLHAGRRTARDSGIEIAQAVSP